MARARRLTLPKRARDRELEAGAAAHFADPVYYDEAYRDRRDDVAFYVERVGRRPQRILECGCGTGRVLLPLVEAGHDVWGIDTSAPALASLKAKVKSLPPNVRSRAHIKKQDMRRANLPGKFDWVIVPFNTILHLYTAKDVQQFFRGVRALLKPSGRLLFDWTLPDLEHLLSDPSHTYAQGVMFYPSPSAPNAEKVRYRERFDYDRLRQILFVTMEFEPIDGTAAWITPLAHRQFFPMEMEALVEQGGFCIAERWGDFQGSVLSRWSQTAVLECRRV